MARTANGGYDLVKLMDAAVYDVGGEEIGTVGDVYVDSAERKMRFLDVAAGGFLGLGERHFLIPIDAVGEIGEDRVTLNRSREEVVDSPMFDPSAMPSSQRQRDVHEHYDLPLVTPPG